MSGSSVTMSEFCCGPHVSYSRIGAPLGCVFSSLQTAVVAIWRLCFYRLLVDEFLGKSLACQGGFAEQSAILFGFLIRLSVCFCG